MCVVVCRRIYTEGVHKKDNAEFSIFALQKIGPLKLEALTVQDSARERHPI